jgi:hypothetical protein
MILTQTGTDRDTSDPIDLWHSKMDQLRLGHNGVGVFAGPEYPYPHRLRPEGVIDPVHPDALQTAEFSEVIAWAMATVEAGQKWSMGVPSVTWTGSTLRLGFDLRDDEHIVAHDAAKYAGAGISNYGLESDATIASVTFDGHGIELTFTGTPTWVAYADQRQDVTGFADAYSAFRGLLRTSLTRQALLQPEKTLYRWLPSFRLEV